MTGTIKSSPMPFLLGANPAESGIHTNFSNITVYETAIFNRALSSQEISNNYSRKFNVQNTTDLLDYRYFDYNSIHSNEFIPESSIESYFVWIPKYSYQLWDLGNYNSLTSF